MNRIIFYRNLIIFFLFVAVIFATPFVFAQDVSSPFHLTLNNTEVQFVSGGGEMGLNLGHNAQIELPTIVIDQVQQNSNGPMSLREILDVWQALPHFKPQPDENGKLLYPVKIHHTGKNSVMGNPAWARGYVDLEKLANTEGSFKTNRIVLSNAHVDTSPTQATNTNIEYYEGGSVQIIGISEGEAEEAGGEVTSNEEAEVVASPIPPIRPQLRPENLTTGNTSHAPDVSTRASDYACKNDWDRRHGNPGYTTTNCLSKAGMSEVEKAQHILNALEAINMMRKPKIIVDSRFSLCVAKNESKLSPNATNGSDWGLFQINNRTGKEGLTFYPGIVEGFTNFNKDQYITYRNKMLTNVLAQADLHHSVMRKKAEYASLLDDMGSGQMTVTKYKTLARRYNANFTCYRYKKSEKTRTQYRHLYARKVSECYHDMRNAVDENGKIRPGKEEAVEKALKKAVIPDGWEAVGGSC